MLPRLLQVRAVAGTIERDFALLPAALRTDASVNGRTKALLLADFADGTTQAVDSNDYYVMRKAKNRRGSWVVGRRQNLTAAPLLVRCGQWNSAQTRFGQ